MMVTFTKQGPPISGAEIALLEKKLGVSIPQAYREFLLLNNGGRPCPDIMDVENIPGGSTDIQVFFGINRKPESSDLFWNLQLVVERKTTGCFLPIACDSGGSLFSLEILKDGSYNVVFIDITTLKTLKVAPDFETFISMIRVW